MSGTNMIEIRNLCKTYGDLVIFDHLDLTLAPDTVYCLTGASGIGKTTLLHMLLGLEAWDSRQPRGDFKGGKKAAAAGEPLAARGHLKRRTEAPHCHPARPAGAVGSACHG